MRCVIATAGVLLFALAPAAPAAAQSSAPTWTEDVAPIMAEKCMNCHRAGQIAPMHLLTYEQASRWGLSIQMMVEERIMPPWHADPAYGTFGNDRRLSDDQVRTISAWVEAVMPRGGGSFEPPEFADATDGFLLTGELGPPDYIFRMQDGYMVRPAARTSTSTLWSPPSWRRTSGSGRPRFAETSTWCTTTS